MKSYIFKEIAKRFIEMEEYEKALELLEEARSLTRDPEILKEINEMWMECYKFAKPKIGRFKIWDESVVKRTFKRVTRVLRRIPPYGNYTLHYGRLNGGSKKKKIKQSKS
ncbi:MAG: hypothetical protein DRP01_11310 [Archaeoglobales archaeon]|nr:MAG: hypothetical protein DRP01_11310 [Archaeoglobales archaeon]